LITKKNKQAIWSLKRKQITLRSALASQKSKKMKKENLKKNVKNNNFQVRRNFVIKIEVKKIENSK
jgi:DNA-binding response OmpR family regulator